MKLVNNTSKCIRCCSRINGRWFDGILPGETLFCDDVCKVQALIKHGCEVVKDKPKIKKPKKVVKEVVEEKDGS